MDFEELQNDLGGISRYQIFIIVAIALNSFGFAITAYSGSILSAIPKHSCRILSSQENATTFNISIENDEASETSTEDSSCYYYNYTTMENETTTSKIYCDEGWVYSNEFYEETTISEWDLVCDRRYLDSIANSLFFVGFFLGSALSGIFSDWYGRRFTFIVFVLLLSTVNVSVSFAQSYALYVTLRFVAAAATIGTRLSGYTLCLETIPTQYRTIATVAIVSFGDVMTVMMSLMAYLVRDWRQFYLILGLSTLPMVCLLPFVPKSPRWLLVKHRDEEAKEIMKSFFKSKGVEWNDAKCNHLIKQMDEKSNPSGDKRIFYSDLFKRPLTRMVTLNVMFGWFVGSLVVYGLVLNITNLTGNPYTNAILNSCMGVLSNIIVYCSKYFGRRRTLSWSYGIAGFCCILSTILSMTSSGNSKVLIASVTCALIGRLFASSAFVVILIVTSEIFPTPVRAMGSGACSMAARIGSIITPFTLQLQYNVPWLTQTVFGCASLAASASSLMLPETSNLGLMATLDDAEELYRAKMPATTKCLRIKQSNENSPDCERAENITLF